MMKIRIALLIAILVLCSLAASAADTPLLPKTFAGWQQTSATRNSTNPTNVDAAYPAILKEYGFVRSESADYTRDGRHLQIKAARFTDASGAYGAFTFYRTPVMHPETIGDVAASANERILIQRSNILVEAKFDRVTAMSASELREFAQALPRATSNDNIPPTLPQYLPKRLGDPLTARYVVGPNALAQVDPTLRPDLVAFDKAPEVMLQQYSDRGATSTLYLLSYPTFQMAMDRLKAFEAGMQNVPGFVARRTGPLVVVMAGNLPVDDEKSLIGSVNYEAEVTKNEATSTPKSQNVGLFVIAIFTLIGILLLFGLGFSLFFGGLRVALQRLLPARFHMSDEDQIIRLNLR